MKTVTFSFEVPAALVNEPIFAHYLKLIESKSGVGNAFALRVDTDEKQALLMDCLYASTDQIKVDAETAKMLLG